MHRFLSPSLHINPSLAPSIIFILPSYHLYFHLFNLVTIYICILSFFFISFCIHQENHKIITIHSSWRAKFHIHTSFHAIIFHSKCITSLPKILVDLTHTLALHVVRNYKFYCMKSINNNNGNHEKKWVHLYAWIMESLIQLLRKTIILKFSLIKFLKKFLVKFFIIFLMAFWDIIKSISINWIKRKLTFTCSIITFVVKRMLFGLCALSTNSFKMYECYVFNFSGGLLKDLHGWFLSF